MQGILAPDLTPRHTLITDSHSLTHTNTHALWTGLNKEIDCARPIHFPREGIPDFNGINLGTLARVVKNSVLFYFFNWNTGETQLQENTHSMYSILFVKGHFAGVWNICSANVTCVLHNLLVWDRTSLIQMSNTVLIFNKCKYSGLNVLHKSTQMSCN